MSTVPGSDEEYRVYAEISHFRSRFSTNCFQLASVIVKARTILLLSVIVLLISRGRNLFIMICSLTLCPKYHLLNEIYP